MRTKQTQHPNRPLPPEVFFRKHGLEQGVLPALAQLGAEKNVPWSDKIAATLISALVELGRGREDTYVLLCGQDVVAAIDDRDIPRLARAVQHLLMFTMATGMAKIINDHVAQDERERDGTAKVPFEMFCVRWHEVTGTPAVRARHVAQQEGGGERQHLKRYYRNRESIDARAPG